MENALLESLNTTILALKNQNEELTAINVELQKEIAFLQHEQAHLKRLIFGSRRERFIPSDPSQLTLDLGESANTVEPEVQQKQITYSRTTSPKKGKAVRLELPSHLPRVTEIIEPENLPEGARKIGEAVTEILEYKPGKIYVKRIERPKYVYQERITIARLPTLPIPQGNAGPGLLAYLLISKFMDHLPFYRLRQMLKRDNFHLAEATMNGWFQASCTLLKPLYDVLQTKVLASAYIQVDETPIPVQTSEKKGATHTGYHWVYRAPGEALVCFNYQNSRSGSDMVEFIKEFKGALQADGYAGYNQLEKKAGIILLACMAHARRYFEQALNNDHQRASFIMTLIQKLYKIEQEAREAGYDHQQRYQLRQEKAINILEEIEKWLHENLTEVLPKSAIGKAISYALTMWPRLKRYTENGAWEIDNNQVENSIRPVALGRKNYLFAGSHEAAKHAATVYSLLGTCKMNGVEPFAWLSHVLSVIQDQKVNALEQLLPTKANFPHLANST
jgi:transposase